MNSIFKIWFYYEKIWLVYVIGYWHVLYDTIYKNYITIVQSTFLPSSKCALIINRLTMFRSIMTTIKLHKCRSTNDTSLNTFTLRFIHNGQGKLARFSINNCFVFWWCVWCMRVVYIALLYLRLLVVREWNGTITDAVCIIYQTTQRKQRRIVSFQYIFY